MVAHRLATLQGCDMLLQFDGDGGVHVGTADPAAPAGYSSQPERP
jgi:hypothetical protein